MANATTTAIVGPPGQHRRPSHTSVIMEMNCKIDMENNKVEMNCSEANGKDDSNEGTGRNELEGKDIIVDTKRNKSGGKESKEEMDGAIKSSGLTLTPDNSATITNRRHSVLGNNNTTTTRTLSTPNVSVERPCMKRSASVTFRPPQTAIEQGTEGSNTVTRLKAVSRAGSMRSPSASSSSSEEDDFAFTLLDPIKLSLCQEHMTDG